MTHLLFSPLTWGLLLAALAWLTWRRLGRRARLAAGGLGAVLLVACTPLGANLLVRFVESSLPVRSDCRYGAARRAPIVVLSGGFARKPTAVDDYAALNPASWRRLRAAVTFRRAPAEPLVIAGGGPYTVKESEMLARLARDWGVPDAALRVESGSTTTWDSAFALRSILPERIRLASSALHLPRAVIAFRAAGFDACALATGSSYLPPAGLGYFIPQVSAIAKSQAALYELAGTAVYRLRAGDHEAGGAGAAGEAGGNGAEAEANHRSGRRGAPTLVLAAMRLPSTTSIAPSRE